MRVATITLYRLSLPLIRPYKLAFGPVDAFDTLLVVAEDGDGGRGTGEATILTGYTDETVEDAWRAAHELATAVIGLEGADAKAIIAGHHAEVPFTATALSTAIEMLEGHPLLAVEAETPVPLLAILNATDEAGIEAEMQVLTEAGYRTLKVKAGFDVEKDLARVAFIQSRLGPGTRIRIDGNQGYSPDDALRFVAALRPGGVELMEQPCAAGDWEAAVACARAATVPMMLDESIYGPADVARAAELDAARFIKLKLMKAGSLSALAKGLKQIRDLGMTPVLGNGVASDVGCWMELCCARGLIDNAGEMNGFLKPKESVFATPIAVEDGAALLPRGVPALIADDALARLAQEVARFPEGAA